VTPELAIVDGPQIALRFNMNVLVSTGARLSITPDGQFWAASENVAYVYWTRFLDVFDSVTVVARAFPRHEPPKDSKAASGRGVNVIPLANFRGIRQFASEYVGVRQLIRGTLSRTEAVYLSLPDVVGDLVWSLLPRDRPFGVGVCGDPYDALGPGAMSHPLRPLMRQWYSHRLRVVCRQACACAYVTKDALQRRYPCREDAFSTHYSSIHLAPEVIVQAARADVQQRGPFHLITVGSFDTWYKAPDILLEALSTGVRRGLDLHLTFVGDGVHRREVERIGQALGLTARVRFAGQLPMSSAVRAELDKADLFVLPSRAEGLPRAMIEAMARALPCIGTTVGGVAELLPEEDLVKPNNASELSFRIEEILSDPQRRAAMSARNLARAQEYRSHILRERRIAFYEILRARTEEWLKTVRGRM
jgi:glycosyltransferase involved in cell wall biosynthesis